MIRHIKNSTRKGLSISLNAKRRISKDYAMCHGWHGLKCNNRKVTPAPHQHGRPRSEDRPKLWRCEAEQCVHSGTYPKRHRRTRPADHPSSLNFCLETTMMSYCQNTNSYTKNHVQSGWIRRCQQNRITHLPLSTNLFHFQDLSGLLGDGLG